MQKSKLHFKIQSYQFLLAAILLLSPLSWTSAAEFIFEARDVQIRVGDQFEVELYIHPNEEVVNAMGGKIKFSANDLSLMEIRSGNSIINYWVDEPSLVGENLIEFSGIIPGGYSDANGFLFSLVFEPINEGESEIWMHDGEVLLHDGEGTKTNVVAPNLIVVVSPKTSVPTPRATVPTLIDTEDPEVFTPVVASDQSIFDGKYFLVFATQDKGSGIDHYEVRESKIRGTERNGWKIAESPYLLRDQRLSSYIYVKAVDRTGNERIAELLPQLSEKRYTQYKIWVIIGIGLLIVYIAWRLVLKNIRHKPMD